MATVIAVTNQKGGVGKTTSAVNIAYYLAKMGKKTLLFEYPQDLPPNQTISDVRFFSDEMVDGKKSSGLFFISVSLDATNKPKVAWVVDTTEPRDKASGLATVASKGEDLILTVKAVNWLGEKLDLLVTCHPPKK